jgi:hypothetical protein
MKKEYTLEETALQMFKDLYLSKIKTAYGECYCLKNAGSRGVFLGIEDADLILSKLPLKALEKNTLIQSYQKLQNLKRRYKISTKEAIYRFNFFGDRL